jgi:anhydro-N-acetylmuramic acid kinase
MKTFRVIGLMSGTSLDGLDVADVTFDLSESNVWSFELNNSALYTYNDELLSKLKSAHQLSGSDLIELSSDLGRFYADKVNAFIIKNGTDKSAIDFLSSHGQTIFHQPQKGYTLQIGNGPELAVGTQLPTVVDFRTKDVALGGNGAPLIPVADHLLFSNYAGAFLNLGGFSNLSYQKDGTVLSFDICPVNIIVNDLMRTIDREYDANGDFGKDGEVNQVLFNELNALPFYKEVGPRSLGWEWVAEVILPLLEKEVVLKNRIRTLYEHIAVQIGKCLNEIGVKTILFTGGGTKNTFLIERIKSHTQGEVVIPNEALIDYKEAIGVAFLGLLRWQNKINVWSSVTGSKRDSSSGVIIEP